MESTRRVPSLTFQVMYVYRPNVASYLGQVGLVGVVVLLGVVAIGIPLLLLGHASSRLVSGAITVLAIGCVLALYFRNVRVELDTDEVRIYGMFGRIRRWPRSDIRDFKGLSIVFRGVTRAKLEAIGIGSDHNTVFRLAASFWAFDDLKAIAQHLGQAGFRFESISKADAIRKYPGSLSFPDRHNWLVGGLIPVIAILVVVILVR